MNSKRINKLKKNKKIQVKKRTQNSGCSYSKSSNYRDQDFNYQLLKISYRIAESKKIPYGNQEKNILSLVHDTFKQLTLNEIEACLMFVYLENFGWNDLDFSIKERILFTGLLSKIRLNSSTSKMIELVSAQNPRIGLSYSRFRLKHLSQLDVDMQEVNQKFNLFLREENPLPIETQYNYLVDEILKTSVPYKTDFDHTKKNNKLDSIKSKKASKHVKTHQAPIRRPSVPSPICLYPADSSIFFSSTLSDKRDSFGSELIALSARNSNDRMIKIPVIEGMQTSSSAFHIQQNFFF